MKINEAFLKMLEELPAYIVTRRLGDGTQRVITLNHLNHLLSKHVPHLRFVDDGEGTEVKLVVVGDE